MQETIDLTEAINREVAAYGYDGLLSWGCFQTIVRRAFATPGLQPASHTEYGHMLIQAYLTHCADVSATVGHIAALIPPLVPTC